MYAFFKKLFQGGKNKDKANYYFIDGYPCPIQFCIGGKECEFSIGEDASKTTPEDLKNTIQ